MVALVDGFHLLDFDTGALTFLTGPERVPGTRFNDGKVSPDGRFFAGTMDEEQLSRPIAALYRLDPDATPAPRSCDGLIVSNGLAWSADGRTMFHSDSKAQVVWTYDYDPGSGAVAGAPGAGAAHRGAGTAGRRRRGREGLLLERGHLRGRAEPVGARRRVWTARSHCPARTRPRPASAARTSARSSSRRCGTTCPPEVLADKPLSGGIFAVRVDVPGVPVARFRGLTPTREQGEHAC